MSKDSGFTFGTWNAGSGRADYGQHFPDSTEATPTSPNFSALRSNNPDDKPVIETIDYLREKLLSEAAEDLARTADVLALQEVSGDDRNDITVFKNQGFEIVRPTKANPKYASNTDTAIAINKKKFDGIDNRSFVVTGADFAVAVATEKATGKKIAFISGHIPGFDLEEPDNDTLKASAETSDQTIGELIKKLKTVCSDCDTIIMGADMNVIPEIHPAGFKLLEDAGFVCKRTREATNTTVRGLKEKNIEMRKRELDYVFVKNQKPVKEPPKGLRAKLSSLFKKETVHITHIVQDKTHLKLDPTNPSDHTPVFVRVEEVTEKQKDIEKPPSVSLKDRWKGFKISVKSKKKPNKDIES